MGLNGIKATYILLQVSLYAQSGFKVCETRRDGKLKR